MKRGKEEEKMMGPPMFPRLHVNDADKGGGPRAPPRNKMALYEQLSIPFPTFTSKPLPLNHPNPNSTSNMVPSVSSNQGSGVERNMAFPRHLPPSTHTNWSEKFHAHHSDVRNGNSLEAQLEQRKKVGDKDDFMVPVFVQPRIGQSHQNSLDRESLSSVSSTRSGHQVERQNISNKDPKQDNLVAVNFRREARNERKENMNGQSGNTVISATDQSSGEKINGPMKEVKISSNQLLGGCDVSNLSQSHDGEACLNLESRTGARLQGAMQDDDGVASTRDVKGGNASWSRSVSRCGEGHVRPIEAGNVCNHNSISNRTCTSLQLENTDKGDDLSETSMVDSIYDMDISPDDIVGIIGQKHFWKARRAIVNQQRVFAKQVFELHKLIKVQRLIAESPHLLLEHGTFLGKSSLKSSPAKKLALEFVVKPFPHVANSKDGSEKPNEKMECSAENAVGKTSISSAKTGSQSLNYLPHAGDPRPVATRPDNKMGPWCFHQSPGSQWLVPVMSPSEGLVYKPYTSPGLSGTVYGEYGTFCSTPIPGNFPNSDFRISTSHHQGIGVFPGTSPVSHTYFPPYIMPAMNLSMSGSAVEQVNQFAGTGPVSGGIVNLNTEQQSSGNVSAQDKGSVSQPRKFQASKTKGSDLQGGTASSPGERAKEVGISHNAKGRDPLPIATVVSEEAFQSHEAATPTPPRVIKVVPHNPRSATESAARIFRFIQEERKLNNPI